jgi:hypothetical protein
MLSKIESVTMKFKSIVDVEKHVVRTASIEVRGLCKTRLVYSES